jgi:phosphatidylethanolamine/phosphatidyl-N-methylethanolamine N-methyltransferase
MEEPAGLSDMERSTAAPGGALRRAYVFLANFIKHPKMVGTFAVSSPALVQRLLGGVAWNRVRYAIELGPGVGTITRAVLEAMPGPARLLAVEMNEDFVQELRRSLPDRRFTVVHGSAADLTEHLTSHRIAGADLVISGIPFSTMPADVRDSTLDAVARSLNPDGIFVVYQYSSHVHDALQQRFAIVDRELEWRNLVPVKVFRCRDPRLAGQA